MKFLFTTFKQHPFAITSFALYIWLWVNNLKMRWQAAEMLAHADNKIGLGELIGYTTLFAVLVTIIFVLALCLRATFSKNHHRFYLFLSGLAIAPLLLLILF